MNVVERNTTHQQGSPPQFQNICKICKKVYKDKAGLMEHQRQQHSQGNISIAQQIQRLQMNRLQKKPTQQPQFSNGNSVAVVKNVESYATLQKPPANLMKPKIQSRKQQFHSPNGESFLREETEDNQEEAAWPKRSKRDDDPPTIITDTIAAATAACYIPQAGTSATASSNGSLVVPKMGGALPPAPSGNSIPQVHQVNKQQLFKNKINPQLLSKIQQNMSSAGQIAKAQQMSPNGKAGVNKPAIPKLMSKSKQQLQILKSQVMRPKMAAKQGPPITTPTSNPTVNSVVKEGGLQQNPRQNTPGTGSQPQAQARQVSPQRSPGNNPPQRSPPGSVPTQGPPAKGRLPPPTATGPRLTTFGDHAGQLVMGARRGNPARGRGGVVRGRGATHSNNGRRESLQSRSPPQSGSGSEESHNSSEGEGEGEDEYSFSTPSPPPPKSFQGSRKSPTRASPAKGPAPSSSPRKISNTPEKIVKNSSNKEKDEKRVYGKSYKCPPMDKVASYLSKKGVRVWICLVCEETEHEISQGPMICCDGCEDWYHFFCVGIEKEPPEDEKWFCKRCIYRKAIKKKASTSTKGDTSESESGGSSNSGKSSGSENKKRSPSPGRKASRGGATRGRGGRGRGRGGRK